MQTVETLNEGLKRAYTVTITSKDIDARVEKEVLAIAPQVRMPGFRPGKVPANLVKKMHGESLQRDALNNSIQESVQKLIADQKLRPAMQPSVELDESFEFGKDAQVKVELEVLPVIEAPSIDGLKLERLTAEVSDAQVEEQAGRIATQQGALEEYAASHKAKDGDTLVIDFVGKVDGEVFAGGSAKGTPLVLGSGRMIPGFEEGLVGAKAGEERVVNVTFPEDYQNLDLAGKAAEFTITVNSVAAPVLPELNEEFFAQFGIKESTLEGFRTEVRKNMERELRQAIKTKVKNQVMDGLLAANPIEVPKALLENEVNRLRVQAVQQFGGNIKPEQLPVELFEEQAKRRVVLGLIVAEVVKQFELKPDDAKVREMIEEMASAYQEPEQVIAWYYKNDQQMNEVRSVVLEEQVVDTVLQKATVTDKSVSYEEAVKPAEAPAAAE